MRFRFGRLRVVLTYVGYILFAFGFLLLVPFIYGLARGGASGHDVRRGTFVIPIVLSLALGAACRWQMQRRRAAYSLGSPEAMLVCVLSWLVVSAVGAIPFSYELGVSYLDAYFESMSGFTTTGITMLTGLDGMPRALLLWRAMTQWIGGLGILTFFMAVVFEGGLSHQLFGAESHKIDGKRPAPGLWNTLKILWLVYIFYTAVVLGALVLCGTGVDDAFLHALTCIATGGYSTYDASIAHYEMAGHAHHVAIEYVIIFGMWAGGTNFLVHFRLLRVELRALWDGAEMRAWWAMLAAALILVVGSRLAQVDGAAPGESFRHGLFQVVAVASTTGYATRDIATDYFTPLARQVFLVLMLVGGCAGSTSGGVKVIRMVILWKLVVHQVRRVLSPASSVQPVLMERRKIPESELRRASAVFFGWLVLLMFGSFTTAALSNLGAAESASGMFSALGNVGPCYISLEQMTQLHPITKLFYIGGMLAGRLEVIPVLILFSRRTWE